MNDASFYDNSESAAEMLSIDRRGDRHDDTAADVRTASTRQIRVCAVLQSSQMECSAEQGTKKP